MSKNKMHKHTRQLEERELLFTALVEITSRAQKHSGHLLYTRSHPGESIYTMTGSCISQQRTVAVQANM